MKRNTLKEIFCDSGKFLEAQSVTVCGWVRTLRDMKSFLFVELNDGSYQNNLQVVIDGGCDFAAEVAQLNVGAAVCFEGKLCKSPNDKQPFELHAQKFLLEGAAPPDYPLQKKRHTLEYLRTIAHLRPRTNILGATFRVRSAAAFAIHKFFNENGFVYANTPLITASDCEGAGEMFKVTTLDINDPPRTDDGKVDFSQDFFNKPAYLTVSGQLQAETFALAFGKTYTFGPTFRAENSNTARHAAEFWMIEPEIAFADLDDNMDLAENMVRYVIGYVLDNCPEEIKFFDKFVENGLTDRLTAVRNADKFARISYTEAIEILEKNKDNFKFPVYWGCDLQTEHERYITEQIMKRPTFITDYPKEIKAFYMRINDDGKTVAAMDMLVPGIGELIGGSQREERPEVLEKRIVECGLNPADYDWYMDLRRYGGANHSGFGLGFERLIMYLTGMSNIRDVIPFPRTVNNAEF